MSDASSRALQALDEITEIIAQARDAMAEGTIVNLGPIETRVAQVCADIAADPPDDGGAVQAKIAEMIGDLQRLAEDLKAQQKQLGGAVVRQAVRSGYVKKPGDDGNGGCDGGSGGGGLH